MKSLLNGKYVLFASLSGFVLIVDQATKFMVHTGMELGETKVVIPYLFNIHYIRNPGGAFGLFGASSELVRFILFLLVPLVCVFFIFLILRKAHSKLEIAALGFILGGAFGNYVDRLRFGSVIDFLDWYVSWGEKSWHWPTFNIADSFIVIGVFILFVLSVWESKKARQTVGKGK